MNILDEIIVYYVMLCDFVWLRNLKNDIMFKYNWVI